jgi:hypothetical protein
MNKNLLKLIISIVFIMITESFAYAKGTQFCHSGEKIPEFEVCYDDEQIGYYIRNEIVAHFDKTTYLDRWNALVDHWLAHNYSQECFSQVSLWVSVPEVNPSAAQLRLVVTSSESDRKFVVFAPLDPHMLEALTAKQLAVLQAQESYPHSFGIRPQEVYLKSSVSKGELDQYLAGLGLSPTSKVGERYYRLATHAFHEVETQQILVADSELMRLVERVDVNHVIEWMADRFEVLTWNRACQ